MFSASWVRFWAIAAWLACEHELSAEPPLISSLSPCRWSTCSSPALFPGSSPSSNLPVIMRSEESANRR